MNNILLINNKRHTKYNLKRKYINDNFKMREKKKKI